MATPVTDSEIDPDTGLSTSDVMPDGSADDRARDAMVFARNRRPCNSAGDMALGQRGVSGDERYRGDKGVAEPLRRGATRPPSLTWISLGPSSGRTAPSADLGLAPETRRSRGG